jgi:hypothetical protein
MSESVAPAKETSAAELIGAPPKQRPPWPAEIPYVEAYKNCGYARHPVDKQFIGEKKARELGCKVFPLEPLKLDREAFLKIPTEAPPPPPEQIPQQPISEPVPIKESSPVKEEQEPAPSPQQAPPDFSDLPPGNQPGQEAGQGTGTQPQPTEAEIESFYFRMAAMGFDGAVTLFVLLFGDFWNPRTGEERKMVVGAIVLYMKSTLMQVLTPLEEMWMAIGLYCLPRVPKTFQIVIAWFKSRKKKKEPINVDAKVETESPKAEAQPHPQPEPEEESMFA